jgi:hypothetical protein
MDLLKTILLSYVRHGLTVAAGYLLAHGLIDQAGGQVLASAGLALAGLVWTTCQKLAANYALQAAAKAMPPGITPPPSISPVTKAP